MMQESRADDQGHAFSSTGPSEGEVATSAAAQEQVPPLYYPNMMHGPREHPQAIVVLVLGIVGVTVVPFIAPVAWILGVWALRQIDANPGAYSRRDYVVVGRILGVVGTLFVSLIVLLILYFVLIDPPPGA